jgi:hypothetical protein
LFQNALDQEKQHPANKASWSYDKETETLTISNATSKLTASSLLLGQTTKDGDLNTIGQFGEGYKIATLVLLRNNKQVTFYNYGAREIWRPRFVKSRRFGTDILTFFIEKSNIWESVPSADLAIEVAGITPDEYYRQIVLSNLHLRKDYTAIDKTEYGDIIDLSGQVYVNGLYVCNYAPYSYGYNFKPEHIKLDRDRKMVSDFDLRWLASKMWSGSTDTDRVVHLVSKGKADVAYLDEACWNSKWRGIAASKFKSVYGPEALPVISQEELDKVPAGYRGVIVSPGYHQLITMSSEFEWPTCVDESACPLHDLQDWFNSIEDLIPSDKIEEFNKIMEELKNAR